MNDFLPGLVGVDLVDDLLGAGPTYYQPDLRRMPYALAALPGQRGRLLVALRGGALMLTDDAGESWTRLSAELTDVIDLAVGGR